VVKKKKIVALMLIFCIFLSGVAIAGIKTYYKERMKNVYSITMLPLDYEIIVPTAMGSKKQKKGYSPEETEERRKSRTAHFHEKFKKFVERKGYELTILAPTDENQEKLNAITKYIKDNRIQIGDAIYNGRKAREENMVFLDKNVASIVKDIDEINESDVFIVPLCRERRAALLEDITGGFGLLGYMAGADSWKDEYMGYIPHPTYIYIHAFVIDSNNLEVLRKLSVITWPRSMYGGMTLITQLAKDLAFKIPKKRKKRK
jgi:hypothetical protein